MKLYAWIFILSFLFPLTLHSQIIESGDIVEEVNSIISAMPGSSGDDYQEPSSTEENDWESMLVDLIGGSYAAAAAKATALGYDLVEFTDNPTATVHYLLRTASGGTNHWGTYILNPSACRSELVVMSPHPKKDLNTGKQGAYCYKTVDAYFFMLSGTNRCNQSTFSTCSGTTSVCAGSSESYRISDMAHVTDAIWQRTTEYLHDNVSGTYFAQLHGFAKKPTDPYVIMSNGTRNTPAPDKIVALRDELLVVDPSLTFKIGHIDLAWNRLLGFSNTNGRYINSSTNACSNNATTTNGRFLHIEQEKTKLRNDSTGWHKMATAMGEAFNDGGCSIVAPLPVELADFSATVQGEQVLVSWTTLSELENNYFVLEKTAEPIDFQEVIQVEGQGNSDIPTHYSIWDVPLEGQNYYRLRQVDFDGNYSFSKIISIFYNNKTTSLFKIFQRGENLILENAHSTPGAFYFFNSIGQLVFQKSLEAGTSSLNLSNFPSGIYFYQIDFPQKIETGKLLIK